MARPPGFERFLRLTHTARELLAVILSEYEPRTFKYYSDEKMAALLDVSRRTVIRCRLQLVQEKYLRPFFQKGPRGSTKYESRVLNNPEMSQVGSPNLSQVGGQNVTPTPKDSTPQSQYDLLLPDAVIRGDLPELKAAPGQRRKAGEFPHQERPTAKAGPLHPSIVRLTQGKVQIKDLEDDQEARKSRDPEHNQEVKRGKGQLHPSREITPIREGHHDARGRDFSFKTRGEDHAGLTAEEQGRKKLAGELKAQREHQEHLPKPVDEKARAKTKAPVLEWDPATAPAGMLKSPLAQRAAATVAQGRLL